MEIESFKSETRKDFRGRDTCVLPLDHLCSRSSLFLYRMMIKHHSFYIHLETDFYRKVKKQKMPSVHHFLSFFPCHVSEAETRYTRNYSKKRLNGTHTPFEASDKVDE